MEFPFKEVFYNNYCRSCIHRNEDETCDPCNDCLTYPVNEYSHKPIRYEKDDKVKETEK